MENSLRKLKLIAQFLRESEYFSFVNFNLHYFSQYIDKNSELKSILESLADKFPLMGTAAKQLLNDGFIKLPEYENNLNLQDFKNKYVESFEEWIVFCYTYLKNAGKNRGTPLIDRFMVDTGIKELEEKKLRFYKECVSPILIFLDIEVQSNLNAVSVLNKYRIFSQWYDRQEIEKKDELEITKKHLSKFLFNNGFTYSLAEVNVPSGRIDNFAFNIGVEKSRLSELPDAIIAEGKFYKGNLQDMKDVKSQVLARMNELGFTDGYCVIYNKTSKEIVLENKSGSMNGIPYQIIGNKKVYYIIINLDESFYKSKVDNELKSLNI